MKWMVMMTRIEIYGVDDFDDRDGNIGSGWV